MNPLALGLFNFVLLMQGVSQVAWAIGFLVPHRAGGTTALIAQLGLGEYITGLIILCVVACIFGAYSKGTRWRAFGVALLLLNNLAIGSFAYVVAGGVNTAVWLCACDGLLALYLALIMAVRAYDVTRAPCHG